MTTPRDRLLLASIHDVAPPFEREIDQLVDEVGAAVGSRMAMLVVPNFGGDHPLGASAHFRTKLRRWAESGIEMILHGMTHKDQARHAGLDRLRGRYMTANEGEFLGLPEAIAVQRIRDGRTLVEDVTGVPVEGFIAPAWLYGEGARRAIERCGMKFAEDHWQVWSPARGNAVLARGPVITWASRSRARRNLSLAAAAALRTVQPQRVVRIGVHPGDAHWPVLRKSIRRTLRQASVNRRPGTYLELFAENSDG